MRKSLLILSCAALGMSLSAACSSDDGNDDAPVAGAPGDGDGDGDGDDTNDVDETDNTTDSAGGLGGGDGDEDIECSSKLPDASDGGAGGAGGSAGVSCEAPEPPRVDIEITGTYTDNWGGTHTITTDLWDTGYLQYALSIVDNEQGFAVARNPAEDVYNPCLWSRFVWTQDGDALYYCQAPYSAPTECAALGQDLPDADDLGAGCNGFSWSELTPSE
ncbi:MAG TPA: hypothetical protein VN764_01360 [Polyangiaceae bacterium]|nr:hypothetical protein [Polyangiaceae bacterium]